ncbi:MAG: type II toxin-antitoxin system VapC family toxin [Blastocatellia bacterium]
MYLWDTNILRHFVDGHPIVTVNQASATVFAQLLKKHRTHKRYPDIMIAAITLAGGHIVVTRNQKHFVDLLPANQLQNWIDDPPNPARS